MVAVKYRFTSFKLPSKRAQQGVSLFVVLIVLLLTLLLVLGSLKVAGFNETIVGNQSDAQRAYAAAEALLDAAQRDIRANGRACGLAECRFPRDPDEYELLRVRIGLDACGSGANDRGVCVPSAPEPATGDPVADYVFNVDRVGVSGNPQSLATGASYDAYAPAPGGGAASVFADASAGVGASAVDLSLTGDRGRYWVEVFHYNTLAGALAPTADIPVPDGTYPFVFRITARAVGLKPGTVSVLRTYYVPYPRLPL